MKMIKRAFVGVLVLALLVSCVAFAALATDKEYTIDNYDEILEYYEEPVIFDYDFEDMTVGATFAGAELQLVNTNQTATIAEDTDGKYLVLTNSTRPQPVTRTSMFLNWNSLDGEEEVPIDDFIFQATVSGTEMAKLFVNDTAKTEISANAPLGGTVIVSLNFGAASTAEANVVKYNDGGVLTTLTTDGSNAFEVSVGEKYNVTVVYVSSSGTYSVEVTKASDPTYTASVSGIATPVSSIVNVRYGVEKGSAALPAGGTAAIHSISAYGGSFFRDPGDRQAETEAAILKMNELFFDDTVSVEDKLGIATVVGKLDSVHGFTSENGEVIAAVDAVVKGSIALYAEQLDACLAGAVDTLSYTERVENVKAYEDFRVLIPDNYADILGDDQQELIAKVSATIDAFEAEVQLVADYKTNSDGFIAALDGADSTSNDYSVIAPYYDAAAEYYDSIYANYEGIADAVAVYTALAEKIEVFRGDVDVFVTNALVAADDTNSFGARYEAYILALAKQLTETDFPGVSTYVNKDGKTYAEAVEALAGVYADVETTLTVDGEDVTYTGMEALIALCDTYIANVNSANTALYMKAQVAFLEAADGNLEVLNSFISDFESYPGFADASDMHDTISTAINASIADAEAYYEAVMELKAIQESEAPLEGDALREKLDEIDVLRQTGDILGVEYKNDQGETVKVDVASANIYLSNVTSAFELEDGYNKQYVARVASIDFDNMTTAELYAAISLAKSAEANEYVTDKYADVKTAMTDLADAVARYNEMIALSNAAFADVNGVGADISSLPANESSDEVSELIKNLFEK